jgi:hypothetical protein
LQTLNKTSFTGTKVIILIFCAIFFLSLFEEKLNKLSDQLNISRISGRISILPDILYPALPGTGTGTHRQFNLVSGRIPDIKKAGFSGRISGASLLSC